jgi:hypothetical protein
MTHPTIQNLRDQGLLCSAVKRNGERCVYKSRAGHSCCGVHGAPLPNRPVTPPPTTYECPVCYDVLPGQLLTCGHSLCVDCSVKWFATNVTCPMCRMVVREPPNRLPSQIRIEALRRNITSFLRCLADIYSIDMTQDPSAALRLLELVNAIRPSLMYI